MTTTDVDDSNPPKRARIDTSPPNKRQRVLRTGPSNSSSKEHCASRKTSTPTSDNTMKANQYSHVVTFRSIGKDRFLCIGTGEYNTKIQHSGSILNNEQRVHRRSNYYSAYPAKGGTTKVTTAIIGDILTIDDINAT